MPEPLPLAVALGDQLQAEMMDVAKRLVRAGLAQEDLIADEDAWLWISVGIGAGSAATMSVLIAKGILPATPAGQ